MLQTLLSVIASASAVLTSAQPAIAQTNLASPPPIINTASNSISEAPNKTLTVVNYSLANRHENNEINEVFSDNILLTLNYMSGKVKSADDISWDEIRAPGKYTLVLNPGQTFAFHDKILPEYADKVSITMNAHYNYKEGFRSDGWLVGDGVCHLASFMNVAALNAGLMVEAPTRHDFAKIEGVPTELGVSIFNTPEVSSRSTLQNLYITNTLDKTVNFIFTNEFNSLTITVEQS